MIAGDDIIGDETPRRCPLSGVKRTSPEWPSMSANDPKRTSVAASNLPVLVDKMPRPEPRGRQ
jgi:hypothetical protein